MRRALTGLCLLLSVVLPLGAWALNAGLGEPPASVDRQTPYATANGFASVAQQGNYALAAHYLDLDFLPPAEQRREGARLAWRLRLILDRKLPPAALATLSTEPEGDSGG